MTRTTEGPVTANHAALCRSTPAGGRAYLTVGEVLRAGVRRAAGRKEMDAAKSTWDSEGGAGDKRTTNGKNRTGALVPQAR